MKVQFSFVGFLMPDNTQPRDFWVDLPQIPREGEIINIKGVSQSNTYVRAVVWYPVHNDDDEELAEPFVYVVVGPSRPQEDPNQARLQQYLTGPRPS